MTETDNRGTASGFEPVAFFAADHATVAGGKAYINGGFWDRILETSYPTQISVSLVAVVRVPAETSLANHRLMVEMEDGNREKLPNFRIEGEFLVGTMRRLEPSEPTVLPVAIPLEGLNIERAGEYWFVLSVDGHEIDRFRIRAMQIGVVSVQPPEDPESGSGDATQAE
jgi:hypothetical protein